MALALGSKETRLNGVLAGVGATLHCGRVGGFRGRISFRERGKGLPSISGSSHSRHLPMLARRNLALSNYMNTGKDE